MITPPCQTATFWRAPPTSYLQLGRRDGLAHLPTSSPLASMKEPTDKISLLRLLNISFAKQAHTDNRVVWPIEDGQVLCVFSHHGPRTGVYTKYAAVCDSQST
jgi:hypothetical protein